jgi:hypothetical protein
VDEGQSDQEVDQLRQSDSDRERAKEKKRKRKRIEEKVERETKRAKKEEEEDADAIEGDQAQKRTQNQTAIRRSSPGSHDEEEEEADEGTDERKGPAGSDDYSAELFRSGDDNEIIEDSEKVSEDLDEDRSMSQDVTGDDEDGDVIFNTHVKGYVILARSGSLNIFSSSSFMHTYRSGSPPKGAASPSRHASPRKPVIPVHSTPNGNGPFYPDLSMLPSPVPDSNKNGQSPGTFDSAVKLEESIQNKLNPSTQNSHPSQEPTPPLSNVDVQSPQLAVSENTDLVESHVESRGQASRRSVFPEGNYKADRPTRTDTLVLESSPSKANAGVIGNSNATKPPKSKLKLKRKRSLANEDSDFFESISSTPGRNREVRMAREPPQLIAGPFGSTFTDGRGRAQRIESGPESGGDEGGGDEDEGSAYGDGQKWPPPRNSHKEIDMNGKTKDDALIAPGQPQQSDPHHPFSQPSDPFLVPDVAHRKHDAKEKDKGQVPVTDDRRKTFGGFGTQPPIPKIDLTLRTKRPHRRIFLHPRQSLPALRRAAGTEGRVPSRRVSAPVEDHNTPHSTSSSPSNMSAADRSVAVRLGVDAMLQRMSDNHGFTLDVVKRLYDCVGDFRRTDAALKKMRESAEAEAISFISMGVNQVDSDEHSHTSRHESPRRVSNRSSGLHFTPTPVNGADISDYSPPEKSRAGQYARLARLGRRHEALNSRVRTVSLGGTGDFSRNIRISGGGSSRATSGAPAGSIGQSPALEPVDCGDSAVADMTPSSPQQPISGEEEDKLLLSGDMVGLKEMEMKMGGPALKRRTAEILSMLIS